MISTKWILYFFVISLLSIQPVFAISNVQHSVDGNKVTLTYQGIPPFWINIRGDTNIGQDGGYLWAKTYSNSFSYDLSFAINPSKKFYYGVKDSIWSNINNFELGTKLANTISELIAKYTSLPPEIDGQIKSNEWSKSSEYHLDFVFLNGWGAPKKYDSFMKMYLLYDSNNIYIGLSIEDPSKDAGENSLPIPEDIKRGYDKVAIYFDEGSATELGSGNRDFKLNFNQEDSKYTTGDNTIQEDGFWYNWKIHGQDLNPDWKYGDLDKNEKIQMKFYDDHYEAEFQILLNNIESKENYDMSDININPKTDELGFTIYYANNDGSEQQAKDSKYAEYHIAIKNTMKYGPSIQGWQFYPENWHTINFEKN